jgi:hypothetical protein
MLYLFANDFFFPLDSEREKWSYNNERTSQINYMLFLLYEIMLLSPIWNHATIFLVIIISSI